MSFTFGAPAGNEPAPPSNSNAPPSTGGFSFGQSTPAPTATTGGYGTSNAPSNAPASTAGFNFAANPAAASNAPAPVFGVGGNSPAPSGTPASTFPNNTQAQQQPPTPNYVTASDFATTFPGDSMASKLSAVLSDDSFESAAVQQQLADLLPECHDWLLTLQVPTIVTANQGIRQQMEHQQHVTLSTGQTAPLNQTLLQQITRLADDLHISEVHAIALLEHAGIDTVRQDLTGPFVVPEQAVPVDNVPWAARELYFHDRRMRFKCLLQLWQWRAGAVGADPDNCQRILTATDVLLQKGVVTTILNFCRNATTRIGMWMTEVANMETEASAFISNEKQTKIAKLHLQQMVQERQYAAECLFFIVYQTQMTCQEVADIIDLIGQLTNSGGPTGGLPTLDPFDDAPDVHHSAPSTMAPWGTATSITKQREEWETEWIQQAWTSGRAPLARCVAILTTTVLAALDTQTLFMNRNTHAPNDFGAVSQYKFLIFML